MAVEHYCEFLLAGPAIVAGDFNHNVRWDKPRGKFNFATTVSRLAQLDLISAYHAHHGAAHGEERHPTLFWRNRKQDGPSYHVDYCFIPPRWQQRITSVVVSDPAYWIALSDHIPLIIDIADSLSE